MADIDAGKLEEKIYTFSFRNKGSIRIPKSVREKGYTQAVDIIIRSISFPLYESAKSIPQTQFYGYATLVFQDALSLEVPIHFPRQRIYYARNEDALSQWRRLAEWQNSTKDWFQSLFSLLTSGAEEPPPEPTIIFPPIRFVELPLREVYVKTPESCQFEIEFSQYQPVAFTDDNGTVYNGTSQQEDGDKDDGLPSDGIQPKRNPPSDPFSGNPAASSTSELGDFFNAKLDTLGAVDPSNAGYGRFYTELVYTYNSVPNDCQLREAHIFFECQVDSILSQTLSGKVGTVCGRDVFNLTFFIDGATVFTEEVVSFISIGDIQPFPIPTSYFTVIG